MNSESWCVGVDGAKSGWIAVWRGNEALMYCVYGVQLKCMLIKSYAVAQVGGVEFERHKRQGSPSIYDS